MSNRAINEHAYLMAYERQKICGDFPETTAFKSYAAKHERKSQYANFQAYPRSAFSAWRTAKPQRVPNDCQQHSTLPETMPTDAASPCWSENWQHHALQLQRGAWPISAHAHWHNVQYAPRVCTLVLFIYCVTVLFILTLVHSYWDAFFYSSMTLLVRIGDRQHGVTLFVHQSWGPFTR